MAAPLLPDHVLQLMSPADRKSIGQTTAAETLTIIEARDEKQLQEQIVTMLNRREIPHIRPSMNRKSQLPPGWPDITFAYYGVPLAFECKSAVGKLSDEQELMHARMTACGWRVYVIRTFQEAVKILLKIEVSA